METLSTPARRIQQRLILEELTRQRASGDHERYIETFRRATVDANPHQIEAVVFALNRLPHGGALMCDEVGLGKTIEAGLIISELRARKAEKILIVVPVALARQWQVELEDLFSVPSTILEKSNFEEHGNRPGVFIVGRELAGSQARAPILRERGPWDLIIVDEAHEMLGGLYKRFRLKTGLYQENLKIGGAKRAGWLKVLLQGFPTLLLTATPLQNNLFELWSLVHFLDRDSTILGPFHEFATLYVSRNGRELKPERLEAIKARLSEVVCRSLRRQVSPFLKVPFVKRTCETLDFSPRGYQTELYQAVSKWLARPDMVIYRYSARALTTLQVRRRMGSSPRALLHNINSMCERALELINDPEKRGKRPLGGLQKDLAELQSLRALAQKADREPDPKLHLLLRVLKKVQDRADATGGSDKLVVFTESKRTLQSIVAYLEKQGLAHQVTSFSGGNEGDRADEALHRWMEEVGSTLSPEAMPGPEACRRAALVHEFKTRTRILVATEAGAKGLNLQFCSCMVNYDLPWNPQRVEQRIGRIHRYGQTQDVLIFNFVNLGNAAESRVYALLKDKLHLFEGLFGASDEILGLMGALDLERRVDELLRTRPDDTSIAFDELELDLDALDVRFASVRKAANDMLGTLRPDTQARLKGLGESFASSLSRYDESLLHLLRLEDPALEVQEPLAGNVVIRTGDRTFRLGAGEVGEPLHLSHPYLAALAAQVDAETSNRLFLFQGPAAGLWEAYLVRFTGMESVEHLVLVGEGDLESALSQARPVGDEPLEALPPDHDRLRAHLADLKATVESRQQSQANRRLRLIEGREADLRKFWKHEESELLKAVEKQRSAQRNARDAKAMQAAQGELKTLKTRLTQHQNQQLLRLAELREGLEAERDSLHQARYLQTEVKRLFAVRVDPL